MSDVLLEAKRKILATEIDNLELYYSADEKRKFLHKINEFSEPMSTKLYIAFIGKTLNEAERKNNKDWYKFSKRMVDTVFTSFESKSVITLQSYLSILKRYLLDTTPQTDTLKTGYIYTLGLKKEDMYKYINTIGEKYRYITPDEFEKSLEESKAPYMCKCLFILIYLGVKGKEHEDLCSIKEKDIDLETGKIIVDGRLLCVIPEKYRYIFKRAMETGIYEKVDQNGNVMEVSKVYMDSPYLIKRKLSRRFDASLPPDKSLIANIFVDMKSSIKNPYVNTSSLYISKLCYDLLVRCEMNFPRHKDLMEFRDETGAKLGFETMKACCRVLLDKLAREDA